jgi:5-methyltetrahydrofolate--homocysteine methyltransferase
MKKAVAWLEPHMSRSGNGASKHGTIVMATVKGDVHDIGKNIVGVVLACNSYEVIDLGVMVPAERILETAREKGAELIGLSGLITPSLDEMVHVAKEMDRQGFQVPLLIGGATTSAKHTAIKIAPSYGRPTVHVKDASRSVGIVSKLLDGRAKETLDRENRAEQERVRVAYESGKKAAALVPFEEAKRRGIPFGDHVPERPSFLGTKVLDRVRVQDLVPYVDWTPFFHVWEIKGSAASLARSADARVKELRDDALVMLEKLGREGELGIRGVYGFFPAARDGEDVKVAANPIHMLRRQEPQAGVCPSLADFVGPDDHVGAFVVTAGLGVAEIAARYERDHDDYSSILVKALADRLAEAFAEKVHETMRREWYAKDERLSAEDLIKERYRGIRPAPGYPAQPDHTEKWPLFELLDATAKTGVELTESCAMLPAASVSAFVLGHPDARYFSLGPIGRDQVEDYARRKGWTVAEAEKWLGPNVGY